MKAQLIKWGQKIGKEIAKNSPWILTCLEIVGTAGTAYFAAEATLKADQKLKEIGDATTKEKAKAIAPLYLKTGLMFIMTSACAIGSQEINAKRQMAIASAYSLSTEAIKELEDKVEETYGEKKLEKLQEDVARDRIKRVYSEQVNNIIDTGCGEQIFCDYHSGQVFKHDRAKIDKIFVDLNEQINEGTEVDLNMVYEALGIRWCGLGELVSFHKDTTQTIKPKYTPEWVDDDHTITCTEIDFYNRPMLSRSA